MIVFTKEKIFHNFLKLQTFLEVLSKVSVNWKTIIQKIKVTTLNDEIHSISGGNLKWNNSVPLYPGGCHSFDLLDYFNLINAPLKIKFVFSKTNDSAVTVYLQERNKGLTRRLLKSNLLSYSGPAESLDLEKSIQFGEIVSLSQSIFSEKDTSKKCRNYPNEEYESYRECDEQFVYQDMRTKYKVMPFWAAGEMNEVSSQV